MEIRVLKYFLAVAREENITRAAGLLNLSQPSLSKQLKDLEGEFGKTLFVRGSRKITLTEDGMLFRRRAEEIVALVGITEKEMSGAAALSGEVGIGLGESKVMGIIGRAMGNLLKSSPNIRLNLYSGNQEAVSEKLERGLIDFGILIEPNDIKKYNYYKIPYPDTRGILTSKDNRLSGLEFVTKDDLAGEPLICSIQSLKNNELSALLPEDADIVATYNLVYNASLLAKEKIGSVLCLGGIINTSNTDLAFIPFKNDSKVYSYLIWKKYQVLSPAARKILEEIQKL